LSLLNNPIFIANSINTFLIHDDVKTSYSDIISKDPAFLREVCPGDVVAIVGDFDPLSIKSLLYLLDLGAIVAPLSISNRIDHAYLIKTSCAKFVVEGETINRTTNTEINPLIAELKSRGNPGLILFSTGTTGLPKAILHDFSHFLKKFKTPRPSFRTFGFLLFDHIGGINTLLHTMFNQGLLVSTRERTIDSVLKACHNYKVELLPTSPTFLRMMLINGNIPDSIPDSLKVITYGTERMDKVTLNQLCKLLPHVEFRQTYGLSELGILRVKSESSSSLFMKIGGEGVLTRTSSNVLEIYSESRMMGYLNANSPFDESGWYRTGDIVEIKNDLFRIVGRENEVINVGGLKFMPAQVEEVALAISGVNYAKALSRLNPITGQHVELEVGLENNDKNLLGIIKTQMDMSLPKHMQPKRITLKSLNYNHRFKRV
jgi:long-chain acyl-CoA synthetase